MQFITLFLTFHLGLDLQKWLFLSGFQTEIWCASLISPVNFSFPIPSTPLSSPPTTIHCPVQIMQLLTVLILHPAVTLSLSAYNMSPLVHVLAKHFFV